MGRRVQQLFIDQTCSEPAGEKIQPDNPADMPSILCIVPGADSVFRKKFTGDELRNEDQNGIDCTAPHRGHLFEQPGERG